MTRILTLILVAGLAAGGPALAQQSTTTEQPPATGTTGSTDGSTDGAATTGSTTDSATGDGAAQTPPADDAQAPAPGSGLTMGADPDAGTAPEAYIKEEIGDWSLQCIRTGEEEEPCQLYQLLTDENGNAVAEFSLFRLKEGGQAVAGATVIVPLETLLTEDLLIGVDGAKGKRFRFSFCNPIGCFARIGLTEQDINAFKRGASAEVTIVPFAAPDVQVKLDLSLSGFTAGYDKASVMER